MIADGKNTSPKDGSIGMSHGQAAETSALEVKTVPIPVGQFKPEFWPGARSARESILMERIAHLKADMHVALLTIEQLCVVDPISAAVLKTTVDRFQSCLEQDLYELEEIA